jgi:hypothetical protein
MYMLMSVITCSHSGASQVGISRIDRGVDRGFGLHRLTPNGAALLFVARLWVHVSRARIAIRGHILGANECLRRVIAMWVGNVSLIRAVIWSMYTGTEGA